MKKQTGYIYQDGTRWVARVTFTDAFGKRRNLKKYCANKTEARRKCDALIREIECGGRQSFDGHKLKFKQLVETYRTEKVKQPVFVGDAQVSGRRSWRTIEIHLTTLADYFGERRIQEIDYADIDEYRLARLQTQTVRHRLRSITSVNRELEVLRAVLRFAQRKGWLTVNPFSMGEPLINKSAEARRNRILSFAEEQRLLSLCTGRRAHLRPLIIAAVDTGLRTRELLTLVWSDLNFETRSIRIRAINAKTGESREVAMTGRLFQELGALRAISTTDSVFGISDNFKRSFASACQEAGIDDLKFHDLRHTCVTRMIEAGLQHSEAMKVSGHSTLEMLNRYLNTNLDTSRRAADALDVLRAARTENSFVGGIALAGH